jgi:DNA polymerase-1
MKRLLLLDTNALLHRSRSAILRGAGKELKTSTGIITTGTYGLLNSLFAAIKGYDIDCVVAAYDAGGNWRKKENKEYKANRIRKEHDPFVEEHSFLVESLLPEIGIPPVGVKGWEADDIIATISRNLPALWEAYIYTCDKDLLQLVNDKVKVILFSSTKKVELVDEAGVERHFGVRPSEVALFKALVGDKSDNITGVKGIGPVKARNLIASARDRDFPMDHILLNMPHGQDQFRENFRLITLSNDILPLSWNYSSPPEDPETIRSLFEVLEFKTFLKDKKFGEICSALKGIRYA